MKLSFDLISDLHIETWDEPFDWTGMATSMLCVVSGDISKDKNIVAKTLTHLGECYKAVFYIDGNDEHRNGLTHLGDSYNELKEAIEGIPNVIYLQDNVVIVDGVAFLGTNGWWTHDFSPAVDYDETRDWVGERYDLTVDQVSAIEITGYQDYSYLTNSIERLQKHPEVKRIVVVTHTVPFYQLLEHDSELKDNYRVNCLGNSYILRALSADTETKVDTWVFGHYHTPIDYSIEGVRFTNNCRGRGDSAWKNVAYQPKRIVIDY